MGKKIKVLSFITEIRKNSWLYKLHKYLNDSNEIHSKIICIKNNTEDKNIYSIKNNIKYSFKSKFNYIAEKILLINIEKDIPFSSAFFGYEIKKNNAIKQLINSSDILFINWINRNFLKLNDILWLNRKKMIWRFYDSWSFTGGCHVRMGCEKYLTKCNECPYNIVDNYINVANKIFERKMKLFKDESFNIIVPSTYIKEKATKSPIFKNSEFEIINNGISNIHVRDKNKLRKKYGLKNNKKYILFGATNINLRYKGFDYLKRALEYLDCRKDNVELITFGNNNTEYDTSYNTNNYGYIKSKDKLFDLYALADVFVGPSLEESFGNVFLESLSCGTPCVIFENNGGATDIIEHKYNGYIAKYKDPKDLANGINYVLNTKKSLSENCFKKVKNDFLLENIGNQYINYFKKIYKNG